MKKGIATETIFYIVIGIVVVGLLTTVVISYVGTARESSDCRLAQQSFCENWETQGGDPNNPPTNWDSINGKCDNPTAPSNTSCQRLGYDVE